MPSAPASQVPVLPSAKAARKPGAGPFSKRHLRRWRLFTLLAVHLLFALHVLHWKLRGSTLAPMEFSESLHTLHDGVVTVGFLFAVATVFATLAFGRYFCGWGCHILAIQDACAWILGRLGIKPRPVRLRVMMLIPLGVMTYIYLWPQLQRLLEQRPQPSLFFQSDLDGWGSLTTRHLFRAMPGPAFAILTLVVCGGAMVYFLGSRSFCYSVCPYGVFFGWADKVAPAGRLVLSGACEGCGLCTLNCKSGVKVIEELKTFGTVVDSNCLRSMDCVAGCPSGAIGVGFRLPWTIGNAVAAKREPMRPGRPPKPARAGKRFDFTFAEEVAFLAAFFLLFLVYRGLYDIGIFMAGSIGVIGGVGTIRLVRDFRRARETPMTARASFRGQKARDRAAKLTAAAFLALTAHSAFVRYHTFQGGGLFGQAGSERKCFRHLQLALDWGLFTNPDVERKLAITAASLGEWEAARSAFAHYLSGHPADVTIRVQYAGALTRAGELDAAYREYAAALVPDSLLESREEKPWRAMARSFLAQSQANGEDTATAILSLRAAMADDPADPSHACNLGFLYIKRGDLAEARAVLSEWEARWGIAPCVQQLLPLAVGVAPAAGAGAGR